jgi:hypothetical protein
MIISGRDYLVNERETILCRMACLSARGSSKGKEAHQVRVGLEFQGEVWSQKA